MDPDPGWPKIYTDPDSDPQHCVGDFNLPDIQGCRTKKTIFRLQLELVTLSDEQDQTVCYGLRPFSLKSFIIQCNHTK
jgi:hypothetical protein